MPTLVMLATADATLRRVVPSFPALHPAAPVLEVGASIARLRLPINRKLVRLRLDVRVTQGQGVAILVVADPLPVGMKVPTRNQRVRHPIYHIFKNYELLGRRTNGSSALFKNFTSPKTLPSAMLRPVAAFRPSFAPAWPSMAPRPSMPLCAAWPSTPLGPAPATVPTPPPEPPPLPRVPHVPRRRAHVGPRVLRRPVHHVVGLHEADAFVPLLVGVGRAALGTPPTHVGAVAAWPPSSVALLPAVLLLTVLLRGRADAGAGVPLLTKAHQAPSAMRPALVEAPVTPGPMRAVRRATPVQGVRRRLAAALPWIAAPPLAPATGPGPLLRPPPAEAPAAQALLREAARPLPQALLEPIAGAKAVRGAGAQVEAGAMRPPRVEASPPFLVNRKNSRAPHFKRGHGISVHSHAKGHRHCSVGLPSSGMYS